MLHLKSCLKVEERKTQRQTAQTCALFPTKMLCCLAHSDPFEITLRKKTWVTEQQVQTKRKFAKLLNLKSSILRHVSDRWHFFL